MIKIDSKEIVQVFVNNQAIAYIYKGAKLLWTSILSCFGNGIWKNIKGWSNKESWKN